VPGGRARFLPDKTTAAAAVAATAKPGDLVLTMGAGDVTALGEPVLAALRARGGPPG
jgi:UDP-N-acetylmuramate--alanine ligase